MKFFNNITSIIVTAAMVLMVACDPIEDRDELKNSYDPDNIDLEVVQTAGGKGNGLTLKMKTPGVIGYWDYLINTKYTNELYVVFPIRGKQTFTYDVATPYFVDGDLSKRQNISKTIEVDIQEFDQPLPQAYYDLVGEDLSGKSWVFDRTSANWWYMSAGGNEPPNPKAVWWNASECCAPSDQGGKMVFDLEGKTNYTYYTNASGEPAAKGTFVFNDDFTQLTINGGPNILGAEGTIDVNGCAKSLGAFANYQIVELTANKMVLFVPKAGCTSGWTWVFVPEP